MMLQRTCFHYSYLSTGGQYGSMGVCVRVGSVECLLYHISSNLSGSHHRFSLIQYKHEIAIYIISRTFECNRNRQTS